MRRALVIGGSVGGLMAGNLLRQAGWDVAIFERATGDLAGRGAGLGLSAELFAVMQRCGARLEPSGAVPVRAVHWLDRSGAIMLERSRAWVTGAWSRVYRPLRDAVDDAIYHPGRGLVRIAQDGAGVTAIFADGATERGDVLVAADGVYSTVRRQFLPDLTPRYAGYVAWRGVIAERVLEPRDHARLADVMSFCAPPGELSLTMPHPGIDDDIRPGHRRFYFIWYRPADDAAMADLCTDEDGRNHGIAIPPPLIRREHVAAVKAAARALLPPQVAAVVELTEQLLLQPITDLAVPRMVFGRAALIGDAAFIARPHVAAGVTKAALDAQCLADKLAAASDIDAALAQYEAERLAWGRALVEHSRVLGRFIGAPADDIVHRDPGPYLAAYGAPNFVHTERLQDDISHAG